LEKTKFKFFKVTVVAELSCMSEICIYAHVNL